MRRAIATAAGALLLLASAASAQTGVTPPVPVPTEDRGLFLNILPAGQGSSVNAFQAMEFFATGDPPPHHADQLEMYASLAAAGDLTDADLATYFKSESFVLPEEEVEAVEEPREGLTILRDSFGVPHIYGETRTDAMFGAGYVTGQDRLFMADVLRHVGRGRVSEFLGPSQANLELDRSVYLVAGYSEAELEQQILRLTGFGPAGNQVIADGDAFIAGINAFIEEARSDPSKLPAEYPALQIEPEDWKPTDLVAIATLIQAVFAGGGGGELANAVFLREATRAYGRETARALWLDLRTAEDPAAPTTADTAFPYMKTGRVDPEALALPEPDSVEPHDPITTQPPSGGSPSGGSSAPLTAADLDPTLALRRALARAGLHFPQDMSNWLAVNADRTAAGHPIAVMGPQVAYFSPEILMEIDIHAPGLDARGATFPGISLYVLLGRGEDFAWSATSGGSDLEDVRAELLCEPGGDEPTLESAHYVFQGACIPMLQRTDSWFAKPTAGGAGPPTRVTARVERTVHGPVIARGTVEGQPVAFTLQRSTFFGELDSAVSFTYLNGNLVHDAESFQEAMSLLTGSFNWVYVDDRDVAYFHSGKYPVRAPGVNPALPSWGTGEWEWRGFVPAAGHPQEINPAKGWISSWNNKPAPLWRAADANWGFGPVHRVDMLNRRLARLVPAGGVTPSDMVEVMKDAATVDLRGQEVLPAVLDAIGSDPDLDPYVELLRDWVATGAHRVDRDGDGQYDDQAAVALMDEWWDRLVHAVFDPQLSGFYQLMPLPFDDAGRLEHVGSSFQAGFYGLVVRGVRMAVGQDVAHPYRVLRCADGTAAACRDALRQSLADAVAELGPDPAEWDADEEAEAIRFTAVGLVTIGPIPWQNRPTFQQVVQVETHRPRP